MFRRRSAELEYKLFWREFPKLWPQPVKSKQFPFIRFVPPWVKNMAQPNLSARGLHIMNMLFRQELKSLISGPVGALRRGASPRPGSAALDERFTLGAVLRSFRSAPPGLEIYLIFSSNVVLLKQSALQVKRSFRPARPLSSHFPPKASSEMSTAALLVARMASILPSVAGRIQLVKNSTLFSCPS